MRFLKKHYPIIGILTLGLALRIWGINFGLPYQFHQDEPIVVNHALAYGTLDFNPHFFIIPPLSSYLVYLFYGIIFVFGRLFGIFSGAEDFALKFFADPTLWYLIARVILGILPGALTIWLTYLLYRKLFGQPGALYAAAVVAISFLPVVNSHYAYVDNLLVFFVLLTYLFLLKMINNSSIQSYIISGVFLGLAVSTKYNAVLLVISYYIAHSIIIFDNKFYKKRLIFDKKLWIGLITLVVVLIATNPFSILDWRLFLDHITHKIRGGYIGWTHHITYSLFEGIGIGLVIAGLSGFFTIFFKGEKKRFLFFISFPALFYLHLALRSQIFSRYALALIPFFAISAAFLLFQFMLPGCKGGLQKITVFILSLILLAPTAIKSVKADSLFSGKDTRVLATRWIEDNLAAFTKIAVDHASFRPQILQTRDQILEKYGLTGYQAGLKGLKERKLGFLLRATEGRKAYNIYFLTYKNAEIGEFLSMVPAVSYDLNGLLDKGIYYVVISYNNYEKEKVAFLKKLKERAMLVVEFSPYYDRHIGYLYDMQDITGLPVASRELFARNMSGPCLAIYKIKP